MCSPSTRDCTMMVVKFLWVCSSWTAILIENNKFGRARNSKLSYQKRFTHKFQNFKLSLNNLNLYSPKIEALRVSKLEQPTQRAKIFETLTFECMFSHMFIWKQSSDQICIRPTLLMQGENFRDDLTAQNDSMLQAQTLTFPTKRLASSRLQMSTSIVRLMLVCFKSSLISWTGEIWYHCCS